MNHSEESRYKVEGLPVEPKPSKACVWRFTEKIYYHMVIGSMAGIITLIRAQTMNVGSSSMGHLSLHAEMWAIHMSGTTSVMQPSKSLHPTKKA